MDIGAKKKFEIWGGFFSFFFLSFFLLLFFLSVRHFLLFPKSSSQEGGSLASSSVESRDPGSSTEQIDPRAIMKAFIQANSQRKEVFWDFLNTSLR